MILDLTGQAPSVLTHECPRTIVLRLASNTTVVDARCVGHVVVTPTRKVKIDRDLSIDDYPLPIDESVGRGSDFTYRAVTAHRAPHDSRWVSDEFQIDITHGRTLWLVTLLRDKKEVVRVYARDLVPGLTEVPSDDAEVKSLWERLLDED